MDWISVVQEDGAPQTAPRLAQTRPSPALLQSYFDQLANALATMAQSGVAHGDLSAYNILAQGDRLVIIDLPQAVDLVGNLNGMDFLQRDCVNICAWFRARGLQVDEHALFCELIAHGFRVGACPAGSAVASAARRGRRGGSRNCRFRPRHVQSEPVAVRASTHHSGEPAYVMRSGSTGSAADRVCARSGDGSCCGTRGRVFSPA